jgi:hypothetical protein
MDKMNTNNFKIFVEALEALPDEIKNNEVDMQSNFEPACGTSGCFAGLISIVANDIPELKKHYTSLFLISSGNASSASTNILKLFVFILSIIFLHNNIDNTVLVNVNRHYHSSA